MREAVRDFRRRLAHRETAGNRGERVLDIVAADHGHRVWMRLARKRHVERRRAAVRLDVAALDVCRMVEAERQHAHAFLRFRAHARNVFIVGVEDDRAALGDGLDELALRLRDIFERAEELHVRLADIRDDADGRRRHRRHGLNLMEAAHADFDDGRRMRVIEAEQRQRQADFIVEIRLRLEHGTACGQHRRRQVFRRRLAVRARDGNDGDIEFFAPRMRELLIGMERIGNSENVRARDGAVFLGRALAAHEHALCAFFHGFGRKIFAIEALALQRDEEHAFADFARIGDDVCERTDFRLGMSGFRLCGDEEVSNFKCWHVRRSPFPVFSQSPRAPARGRRNESSCPSESGSPHGPCRG